jgi:hypothetical protein
MFCNVESAHPPIRFEWLHNGNLITTDRRHSLSELGSESSTLLVRQVEQSDDGNYTCKVQDRIGTLTASLDVQIEGQLCLPFALVRLKSQKWAIIEKETRFIVNKQKSIFVKLGKPEWKIEPIDRWMRLHSQQQLVCEVTGNPKPEVKWYETTTGM